MRCSENRDCSAVIKHTTKQQLYYKTTLIFQCQETGIAFVIIRFDCGLVFLWVFLTCTQPHNRKLPKPKRKEDQSSASGKVKSKAVFQERELFVTKLVSNIPVSQYSSQRCCSTQSSL